MPLPAIGIGLGTALAGAATGAATIYGARAQANASRRAGDIQATAADRALAYEREREAMRDRLRRQHEAEYAGWRNGPEVARLGDLVGLARGQAPVSTAMPQPRAMPAPSGQNPTMGQLRSAGSGQTQAAAANISRGGAGGRLVRIQSPFGDVRDVPEERASYFVNKGGRVL
jgi:hypothetical protein